MNVLNPADDHDRDVWVRVVKAAVVISCGAIPAIVFGGEAVDSLTSRTWTGGEVTRSALILALLFLSPAGLYAALIRTKVPVVCCGVGLVALEAWSIWSAHAPGSDGLELLAIPFFGVPFVLLVWAIELWIRAMRPLTPPL